MSLDHHTRLPAVAATAGCVYPDDPEAGDAVRPSRFGDPAAAYRAARESAAVFDLHDRTQLVVTGSDAIDFLNNFCTAPLKSLGDGAGAEAFFPNIKGRVISHAFVFKASEAVYLAADPGQNEPLLTHLRKYKLMEDVELIDSTGAWGELLVAGPRAARVIESIIETDIAALPMLGHLDTGEGEARVVARRVPLVGGEAFTIAAQTTQLDELWPRLLAAGATAAGQDVYEALRIEAGWPQTGLDLTDAHLVQEAARTGRAVSFEKGCYLGQEPIARLDAMGHTNRELRTLRIAGEQPLGDGVVTLDDAEVGRVSSSAAIPGGSERVAIGLVKIKAAAIGTQVAVDGREATVEWAG